MQPSPAPGSPIHPVVELRRYRLRADRRDELVDLFDRELVETQEATGMQVVGQFRDLDRPDDFVWLRAFPTMADRRSALEAFYGGPVWARHGPAAAATMIDSDDVLLLRPLATGLGLHVPATRDAGDAPRGAVLAVICDRPPGDPRRVRAAAQSDIVPAFEAAGARTLGVYETDPSENDYAPLPVRDADVIVVFGAVGGSEPETADTRAAFRHAVDVVAEVVGRPPEVLRLAPTPRSLLDARRS